MNVNVIPTNKHRSKIIHMIINSLDVNRLFGELRPINFIIFRMF